MPDREKVIKGLEEIIDYFFDIYRNDTDSYKCAKAQEYSDCAIDAITMLKEQEAAKPLFSHQMKYFVCPKCSLVLDEGRDDYCPSCGARIAWDEYYIDGERKET